MSSKPRVYPFNINQFLRSHYIALFLVMNK